MNDDDKIEMTFTRNEWKLIAIALMRFPPAGELEKDFMVPKANQLAIRVGKRVMQA